MTPRWIQILTCTILAGLLLSCGGVSQKDCSDQQIVDAIKAKIKADSTLSSQMQTINVTAENGYVEVFGWTADDKSWEKVKGYVTGTECVVGKPKYTQFLKQKPPENHYLRPSAGGSCVPGTKKCGEICIPEGEKCNI